MATMVIAQEVSKTDPDHQKTGGFGYLIGEDRDCSVWWAEAAYKVLRDTHVPKNKDGKIKMWSAKNEFESFILVVKPVARMENFRISFPYLKDGEGNKLNWVARSLEENHDYQVCVENYKRGEKTDRVRQPLRTLQREAGMGTPGTGIWPGGQRN
ncbi:MAG: hypothetical protein IPI69_13405 [Bacteroidales bacterium]|nr:hypothetical protein [Bacteroidales bacterium]